MPFLRFLIVLTLVIWIGGIIFFAFVLAPVAFSPGVLPDRHLAGSVVGRSLASLHAIAIVSGVVFLIASMFFNYKTVGSARPLAARHLLIMVMLVLTLVSQFAITRRMHALRAESGTLDSLSVDNPLRMEFDRLHGWSEKVEGAVLLLGLAAIYKTVESLE